MPTPSPPERDRPSICPGWRTSYLCQDAGRGQRTNCRSKPIWQVTIDGSGGGIWTRASLSVPASHAAGSRESSVKSGSTAARHAGRPRARKKTQTDLTEPVLVDLGQEGVPFKTDLAGRTRSTDRGTDLPSLCPVLGPSYRCQTDRFGRRPSQFASG